MVLEDVIAVLINQGILRVWFHQTEDSSGAKVFQLLNMFGDELAWGRVCDGAVRWHTPGSSLPVHPELPDDATEFILEELLQHITQDVAKGSAVDHRSDWSR